MFINEINIIYYILVGILGIIAGQCIDWCNIRLPEYEKVISKEFFTKYLKSTKPKYLLWLIMAIIYMTLLATIGWGNSILSKLELIKYMLLSPMLISAFMIDWKLQIIPNRLNLTMFEIGLVITVIQGIFNINIAINMLLGSLVGAGIFLLITIIGGAIAGKEAMGFGDVKLMGALGLFFGWTNMIIISLISFLLGAIISIILIVTKIRKTDEYIPFGPFIVISAFIVMIVPSAMLIYVLLKIFTLGMYKG